MTLTAIPVGHEIEYVLDSYYTEWRCDRCEFLHFRSDPVHLIRRDNETRFLCIEHGGVDDEDDECSCHCHEYDICPDCGDMP